MKVAVASKSFSKNEQLISEISEYFPDIRFNHGTGKLTDDELIEFLKDCDGAVIALEDINEYVLSKLPKLKAVSKFGVGLDNIDQEACKKFGIKIGWRGGVNRASVAEMALGFMLMLKRNLYQNSIYLSHGKWNKDGGESLFNKKIGVIGVGYIGKELIRLLEPFQCKIFVNDIIDQKNYYTQHNLYDATKEEIYRTCDVITLHTPLTSETLHMINKDTLSLMKPNAIVINTARGDLINLDDLKEALKKKSIKGAAIDVYHSEPPQDMELLTLENLICTPHIGGNSVEAVLAMGKSAIKLLMEALDEAKNN